MRTSTHWAHVNRMSVAAALNICNWCDAAANTNMCVDSRQPTGQAYQRERAEKAQRLAAVRQQEGALQEREAEEHAELQQQLKVITARYPSVNIYTRGVAV
jgi:hypothetical protein